MTRTILWALAGLLIVTMGCGSSISVSHDWDREYDFEALKVYAWIPITSTGRTSELKIRRMVDAINNQLQSQGYTLSTDNPDFLVALHGTTKEQMDVTNWGYGYGARWGAGWGGGVDVSQWTEGTLIVDIVDAESRHMIWRGTAQAAVDQGASPEKQEERFAKGAAQLFSKFPPKK